MAKTLSNSGITTGNPVLAAQVSQSVQAFTGAESYDITISGSLNLPANTQMNGTASEAIYATSAGTVSGPTATVSAAITRWFSKNFIKENPLIIDKVKKWILSNDPSIYPKIYKILAYDLEEIIKPQPPINCPTLIITADQDFGNGPEMSEKIANEISQSQLHIMRNLKHMGLVEDPNQFGSIIKPFLQQFITVGPI